MMDNLRRKKEKILQLLKEHHIIALLFGMAIVPLIISFPQLVVDQKIPLGHPHADIAITAIQLIALTLPALAILLQVSISLSRSGAFALSGEGTVLRQLSFAIVGFASFLMVISMAIIITYLQLPQPLALAITLIGGAISAFAIIPILIAFFLIQDGISAMEKVYDATPVARRLQRYDDFPKEYRESLVETLDIEMDFKENECSEDSNRERGDER